MLNVYRVKVEIGYTKKGLFVSKCLIPYLIVKSGRQYLTVRRSEYTDTVRVPVSECYTDLEAARKAADAKAEEQIARLTKVIDDLKAPAKVLS